MNTVYKVVKPVWGRFYSSFVDKTRYEVEYKLNEIIKPTIGKLFVFKSLKAAAKYLNEAKLYSDQIFATLECETESEIIPIDYVLKYSPFLLNQERVISNFWNHKYADEKSVFVIKSQWESFGVDSLIPKKIVEI